MKNVDGRKIKPCFLLDRDVISTLFYFCRRFLWGGGKRSPPERTWPKVIGSVPGQASAIWRRLGRPSVELKVVGADPVPEGHDPARVFYSR